MKIFVSHDHRDKAFVDALQEFIDAVLPHRIEIMSSSGSPSAGGINAGEEWFPWIEKQVRESDAAIVMLTPNSIDRPWLMWEAGAVSGVALADKRSTLIIPLFYRLGLSDIPAPLQKREATSGEDAGKMTGLLETLNGKLGSPIEHLQLAIKQKLPDYLKSIKKIPTEPSDLKKLRESLVPICDARPFLNAYGLRETLRKDGVVQSFKVSTTNVEPVQYLWADSRVGNWIKTELKEDDAYLRILFSSKAHSLGCNIAFRSEEATANLKGMARALLIDARVASDSELREIGIGIRLVNGYHQHWTLHRTLEDSRLECVRATEFGHLLRIDLDDSIWELFGSDGTYKRGPEKRDFSIISSVNIALGSYDVHSNIPCEGQGILEINEIRLE